MTLVEKVVATGGSPVVMCRRAAYTTNKLLLVHPGFAYAAPQQKYGFLFSVHHISVRHSVFRRFDRCGNREEEPVLPRGTYQVPEFRMNPTFFN